MIELVEISNHTPDHGARSDAIHPHAEFSKPATPGF